MGLIVASASVAWAKLQCPPAESVGRIHPATIVSSSIDGEPVAVPSAADAPLLAKAVFKTEYVDLPDTVHAEVFDSFYPNQVRIVHLTQMPQ